MTVATMEFIDCTGGEFYRSPLVAGQIRAVYVTGSGSVPETPSELADARAAGEGLILIDQTPGLALFAAGKADVGDIEYLAGTDQSAGIAVGKRQALGLTEHTLYASQSALPPLEAGIANPAGVGYWVANYSWSLAQSQALLAANPAWRATQFGDPGSNPLTLVPGTSVNLQMAQADIDCGLTSWLAQFLGGPAPSPTPAPAPPPAPVAPAWPFGPFDYLGTPRPDPHCHSGYYSSVDRHVIAIWQQRMRDRGWYYQGARLAADGDYGINEATLNQGASPSVCAMFQAQAGLSVDHLVGPLTWAAAWTAPVTP